MKRILPEYETECIDYSQLEEAVFQALGFASMCWTETPSGIFQSDNAKQVGDELIGLIGKFSYHPWLGLATTRELLEELWARIEVDGKLDYRTVGDY